MLSLPGKATGQVGVVEICPCMVELLELYCNAMPLDKCLLIQNFAMG
jgi:hypothetical protein